MRYFYLIILIFWLPAAKATECATQIDIPEQECDVLINIFNSTTGGGWFDLFDNGGWMIIQAPCSLIGVVCSDGHVIQVDRTNKGLDGTLPDLTNLTHLEVLNLADNQITGTIEAAKLPPSLQELSLKNNPLTGIPDLSTLPNLVTVDLDFPLTVNKSGQGTVTSSSTGISCGTDCTFSYNYGTSVTLSATPSANFFLVGVGLVVMPVLAK